MIREGMQAFSTPLRFVKGVGPERSKILSRLGAETIGDLLHFYPRRYENRLPVKTVSELTGEDRECVEGTVVSRVALRSRGNLFKAVVSDGKTSLFCVWFHQPYLAKLLLPKKRVRLYGKAERSGRHFQMTHPEYELIDGEPGVPSAHSGRITPIYPLTEDLTQKGLRQLVFRVLETPLKFIPDNIPYSVRKKRDLMPASSALHEIHFPQSQSTLERARRRLVFEELFRMQLAIQIRKTRLQKANAEVAHVAGEDLVPRLEQALSFALTDAQRSAIGDILTDMKRSRPMNRLVQGDVGSGKTAVAAAALLFTAANGFQGALMAPTEVLAQQHYFSLNQLLEPMGIACAYLAQNIDPAQKKTILEDLAAGRVQVVIGTHSLIQSSVRFAKLGLAVIDEQHKFGVFQRAALREKSGSACHLLLLTATPIPRTLAMTLYGDLDVSSMRQMPKGRKTVKTFWVEENKRPDVYAMLKDQIALGRQAYVICPLIENAGTDVKSALSAHAELVKLFSGQRVGLLHGRMKGAEKSAVMADFKSGKTQILVSTVVIEVGVDVPNASIMIVENAERFGLAQLHQLRGRVGRGAEESFCVLFSSAEDEETVERLRSFEVTPGGFEIAEKDLALRGGGDLIGKKQHGMPELKIADLARDMPILLEAREEAVRIIGSDPELKQPLNAPLKRALAEHFVGGVNPVAALA